MSAWLLNGIYCVYHLNTHSILKPNRHSHMSRVQKSKLRWAKRPRVNVNRSMTAVPYREPRKKRKLVPGKYTHKMLNSSSKSKAATTSVDQRPDITALNSESVNTTHVYPAISTIHSPNCNHSPPTDALCPRPHTATHDARLVPPRDENSTFG